MKQRGIVTRIDGKEVNIQFEYEVTNDKKETKRNRDKVIRQIKTDLRERLKRLEN